MSETRTYLKGTLRVPPGANKGKGQSPIYKRWAEHDPLYYKKEGQYFCSTDDKPAKGYILKDHNGDETFMPLDFTDLITYDEARRIAAQSGVVMVKPGHHLYWERCPPPLLKAQTPHKTSRFWNRDAIDRHIKECLRRRKNAHLR